MQEDFHALTYGFKMAGDETEAAVMSPVKELEEELGRIIKVSPALCLISGIISFLLFCVHPSELRYYGFANSSCIQPV